MGKNNLENRVGEQVKCMKSSGKNERSYHNVEVQRYHIEKFLGWKALG